MEQIKAQVQASHQESTRLEAGEPARFLQWDSDFFGARIATVRTPNLTKEGIARLWSWCRSRQIECLYFLAATEDLETRRLAEDSGFRMVDIRTTLARPMRDEIVPPEGIRPVKPSDISHLKRLAAKSFTNTRFYNDQHFSREKCEELYATWAERSCDGYADCVFVVDLQGLPAGFITCSLEELDGIIGLLAVDGPFQGSGVGQALVRAALRYFRECGMTRARVVTQGSNARSQRLYQRCGFVTELVQVWYHRWCAESEAPGASNARRAGAGSFSAVPAGGGGKA